ncbi:MULTISPECIES: hypothetical protein [unclassified Mesorhizobium]|uniref:hypothetical protein n=1 Tax=Mesorhizobium TaxID=68287 RepID=UPI0003CF24B8|nr:MULTISPECIES: hypothetical protein [unclassified Mesorhizobium]ESY97611.1 hypothetical protein X741_00070 [Mesorhizobium sp. LNHC229A00]
MFALAVWTVDWVAIRGVPFPDLQNYIMNFDNGAYYVSADAASVVEWYAQEYLWRKSIYALKESFELRSIFSALALVALLIFSTYVAVKASAPAYLLLLVHPQLVDLAFSQVRSATAMAAMYLALLLPWRLLKYGFVAVATFIHSAVLVFVGAFAVGQLITRFNVARRHHILISAGYIGAVVVAATLLKSYLLGSIGDRRATIEVNTSGFLLTIMVTAYAVPFIFFNQMFSRKFAAFIGLLASSLCFAMYLYNQNGIRFVALSLPALAVAISGIPDVQWRRLTLTAAVASQVIFFGYWAKGIFR